MNADAEIVDNRRKSKTRVILSRHSDKRLYDVSISLVSTKPMVPYNDNEQ